MGVGGDPERISELLASVRRMVDPVIERYIPRFGRPEGLFSPIWDLLDRGGKRFRPALTLLACEAVGGDPEKAVNAAAAVELLHNMTLIHDDIEDGSLFRRGKPCIHIIYGIPSAINAGDAMLIKVFEVLSDGPLPPEFGLKLVKKLAERAFQVTVGQAMEFEALRSRDPSDVDVIGILRNKTGALTALALELGGIAGGAGDAELRALARFGEAIGIGFQIIDDVLNVDGQLEKYGKEIGGDIREGKITVMVSHLLRVSEPRDRDRFLRLLGKKDITEEEVGEAIALYRKYGSIGFARDLAREFIEDGLRSLENLPKNEARDKMRALAEFLIKREM
ncbi:MAG: polyprenyl synthetase family protein [Candidatus Bathyarchaeia archaeon]